MTTRCLALSTFTENHFLAKEEKSNSVVTNRVNSDEWVYDHFVCLVLLYASYADYDFSNKEKSHILSIVHSDILKTVESTFNVLGEYAQLDLILTLKKKFITDNQEKEKLFKTLSLHFDSDGEYSRLESGLYQFLDRLI